MSSGFPFKRLHWFLLLLLTLVTVCLTIEIWFAYVSGVLTKICPQLSEINSFTYRDATAPSCKECSLRINNENKKHKEVETTDNNDLKVSDAMTAREIFQYLQWTNSSSCRLAADFGFNLLGGGVNRLPDGHKAICLDPQIRPVYNQCLVYSFGVGVQWTFDEAMANFRCQVFSFDPSLGIQDYNRSEFIHFFSIGLGDQDITENHLTSLGNNRSVVRDWKLMKASSIYDMLKSWHGEKVIDVLKMDIEYAEWPVLKEMIYSKFLASKVKQLAVEIHLADEIEKLRSHVKLLKELESPLKNNEDDGIGGFARFSSRYNPFTKEYFTVTDDEEFAAYELAWYNERFL